MLGGPRETRIYSLFLGLDRFPGGAATSLGKRGDSENCGRDVRVQAWKRVRTASNESECEHDQLNINYLLVPCCGSLLGYFPYSEDLRTLVLGLIPEAVIAMRIIHLRCDVVFGQCPF